MSTLVHISDDGGVRIIRMSRPDKKNALNSEMYDAMAKAIDSAGSDDTVRCLLIAGAPGAFCAGNDLKEFQNAAQAGGGLGNSVIGFLHALARNEKPLVASVQGIAVGVGTTMLLHCDYVAAATDAHFSTPFVGLGLVPEAASSLLAPLLMGQRRAFALLVMGHPLDAEQAKDCGLINVIADASDTDAVATSAARHIASLPPAAVMTARRLMRASPEITVRRIDEEAEHFRTRLQSDEARAAFESFFSRKK